MSATVVDGGDTTREVVMPPAVDLIDRPVLVEGWLSTVTAVREGVVFTAREPGVAKLDGQVVCLPVLGEAVTINSEGGETEIARGFWLGPAEEGLSMVPAGRMDILVLCSSNMRRLSVTPGQVEATKVVTGKASEGERAALEALLRQIRDHDRWKQSLASAAHDEANDQGWCGDFDDFMDRVGLPRRVHDFDLRVEVTATVYLACSGESVDAAIKTLTAQDVFAALGSGDLEWTAEEE